MRLADLHVQATVESMQSMERYVIADALGANIPGRKKAISSGFTIAIVMRS